MTRRAVHAECPASSKLPAWGWLVLGAVAGLPALAGAADEAGATALSWLLPGREAPAMRITQPPPLAAPTGANPVPGIWDAQRLGNQMRGFEAQRQGLVERHRERVEALREREARTRMLPVDD